MNNIPDWIQSICALVTLGLTVWLAFRNNYFKEQKNSLIKQTNIIQKSRKEELLEIWRFIFVKTISSSNEDIDGK